MLLTGSPLYDYNACLYVITQFFEENREPCWHKERIKIKNFVDTCGDNS